MLKKELEQIIKEQKKEIDKLKTVAEHYNPRVERVLDEYGVSVPVMTPEKLEDELEYKENRINNLENRLEEKKHHLDHMQITLAYLEGQLEALKRESGRYPEMYPTREEWKERRGQIVSTIDYDPLPF
jgi:predicted RNase H-like nuclease (RuvC/YqgF family)